MAAEPALSPATDRAIDRWLPRWHFRELHRRSVHAPISTVWRAVLELRWDEIAAARFLLRLRSLFAPRNTPLEAVYKALISPPFVLLEQRSERETVVGLAGRVWKIRGGDATLPDADAFVGYQVPGSVRVASDLRLEEVGPADTVVSTETRIEALDSAARRRFALYWVAIRLGSGFIRRVWLGAIARRAEREAQGR